MFTQKVAGRVFDFNREVKLTPAWRSRTMVSVAVGEGDAVYVVNRGTDYHPNLPWNHAMRGNRLSKITVGTEVDDEKFLAQFGTDGDSPGQFTWPVAVALDAQENGYVTDEWLNRVTIYDKEGQFLGFWGKGGSGEGEFDGPSGIAFDRNGELYIVDSRNHRVQRYTKQGEFLGQWGKEGSGPGEFSKPWGLTIDRTGAIYVADHKNHRVQKLSRMAKCWPPSEASGAAMDSSTAHRTSQSTLMGTCTCATGPTTASRFSLRTASSSPACSETPTRCPRSP